MGFHEFVCGRFPCERFESIPKKYAAGLGGFVFVCRVHWFFAPWFTSVVGREISPLLSLAHSSCAILICSSQTKPTIGHLHGPPLWLTRSFVSPNHPQDAWPCSLSILTTEISQDFDNFSPFTCTSHISELGTAGRSLSAVFSLSVPISISFRCLPSQWTATGDAAMCSDLFRFHVFGDSPRRLTSKFVWS